MGSKKRAATPQDLEMGRRIREARERLGVSVSALGYAYSGTKGGRQRVQFWERGENFPPAADLPRLCKLLHIDGNYLLGTPAVSSSAKDYEAAKEALLKLAETARIAETEPEAVAREAPKKRRSA